MSATKDRHHLLVGEALAHLDCAVGKADASLLAGWREVDERSIDVADAALLQAGEMVADQLRKHGDDALRQVNAGGALAGFAVERAARRDEMSHVGDVDAELPVAGFFVACQGNRVVEVACIHGVNSDDDFLGEILAAVQVVFAKGLALVAGLLFGIFGELVGKVEGANDRECVHAGLAAGAEDFGDDALAAILRRREADHLEDDLVVRLGPLRAGVADVDAVAEDRAIHAYQSLAVALVVGADEVAAGALQHADDRTRRVDVGAVGLAREADEDGVAGGGVEAFAFGNADFGAGLALDQMGPDVAGARRGAAERAGDGAVGRDRADGVVLG